MTSNFGEDYYMHGGCGGPYTQYREFFHGIAERIVADFAPTSVLDAGCAFGYLVEALRELGVEAYGIDISTYAINQVSEDVRPYCKVASLLEDLPDDMPHHYDLVTNIEVLEHLHEKESLSALAKLCTLTERIVFSSTPDDITEPTHYNVRLSEYWCLNFAEHGFRHALDYQADYISPQAMLFHKEDMSPVSLVEDYERHIRLAKQKQKALRVDIDELSNTYAKEQEAYSQCLTRVSELEGSIAGLKAEARDLRLSHSYRVGHAVLTPLRALSNLGSAFVPRKG